MGRTRNKTLFPFFVFVLILILIPVVLLSMHAFMMNAYLPARTDDITLTFSEVKLRFEDKEWVVGRGATDYVNFNPQWVKNNWYIDFYTAYAKIEKTLSSINLEKNDTITINGSDYVVALWKIVFKVDVHTIAERSSAIDPQQATAGGYTFHIEWAVNTNTNTNITIGKIIRGGKNSKLFQPDIILDFMEWSVVDCAGIENVIPNADIPMYSAGEQVSKVEKIEDFFKAYKNVVAKEEYIVQPFHAHSFVVFDTCRRTFPGYTEVVYEFIVFAYTYKYVPHGAEAHAPLEPAVGMTNTPIPIFTFEGILWTIVAFITALVVLYIILRVGGKRK